MRERQPKWLSQEPARSANAEFQETLKNDPFVGAVAVEALANFIKATDSMRGTGRKAVSDEEATAQIIARITEAHNVAEAAPDATYAQIFGAQLQGWELASKTLHDQPTHQEKPTRTDKKNMSRGKI